jgi:hypothetical protein
MKGRTIELVNIKILDSNDNLLLSQISGGV